MFYLFSKRLYKLAIPLLLLLFASIAAIKLPDISPSWLRLVTDALPYVSVGLALYLSIQFNRSRYSLLLVLLVVFDVTTVSFKSELGILGYSSITAILMLNLFLLSLCKDRGLFSFHGFMKLVVFGLQIFIGWIALQYFPQQTSEFLQKDLLSSPEILFPYNRLPDVVLLIGLLLIFTHIFFSIVRNSSVQATFMGGQLVVLVISMNVPIETIKPFLLSSCYLMVALAVIMDSYDMAYRDELTLLPSRRALNQKLLSLGRRYTIAMLDIDHFKKFNDAHGHDVGDQVLKMVASKLNKVSGGGKAYRYGGEEFTIVFCGKSIDQVQAHLESLRQVIQNYKMIVRNNKRPKKPTKTKKSRIPRSKNNPNFKSLSVTISIGLAQKNTDQKYPEMVIKKADQALYRAKKKGRNCVSV